MRRLKKIYSNLTEAVDRAQAVYGPFSEWCPNSKNEDYESHKVCVDKSVNRILEFMKISKDYGDNTQYILSDGSLLSITIGNMGRAGVSKYISGAGYYGSIRVDIDGPNKGKNRGGYDVFAFDVTDKGVYPEGLFDEDLATTCFGQEQANCTRWVVEVGNMDYLKADTSGKCPDGTQLSWTQTSCK